MKMKFNFGCGPLVLKGTTNDGFAHISIDLEEPYDNIPVEVISDLAEKLYSNFDVAYVALYKENVCICEIDKKEEED